MSELKLNCLVSKLRIIKVDIRLSQFTLRSRNVHRHCVITSQKTHVVIVIKTNKLKLPKENSTFCGNRKHINILSEQNAVFYGKADGT
jgi:ribosomal protein L4